MPFGPYPNFDACVAANQDKDNPEAYCAAIERNIKEPMPESKETSNTHTVEGVEIFAAGTWTDSQGQEREWTQSDLQTLLDNFNADSQKSNLPIKVGHTDDSFNARVADELGIPNSLLIGDQGNGAARLGYIANVRLDGSTLVADLEGVPNSITQMIEAGLYNAVSVEIDMPSDGDPHLSGIAILGAELPAVDTLAALDTAKIFSTSKSPWITLSFKAGQPVQVSPEELAIEFKELDTKMEDLIKGKKGARLLRAFWSEVRSKMFNITDQKTIDQKPILTVGGDTSNTISTKVNPIEGSEIKDSMKDPIKVIELKNKEQEVTMGEFVLAPEDLPRLYEALDLPADASIEDVLKAIKAMGGKEMPKEEPMGLPMAAPEAPKQENVRIAALEAELNQLKGFNKKLEHERLVMSYAKHAANWVTMSGTPEQRGEELASIHEAAGKEIAGKVMSSYAAAHQAATEAGVLKSLGATHRQDDAKPDVFQDVVDSYAKDHSVSFEKALVALSSMPKYSAEFKAYTKRVNAAIKGGR